MATVNEALTAAVDGLEAMGIDDARLDAEVLLSEANGWDRAYLAANPKAEVSPLAARQFGAMVRRRLRREPVAYILGRKGFRRIELAVDSRVLIPRPETELLVELALELRPRTVLDVGTGSGAIALAIADELPDCEVTATDTSVGALEVAGANAEQLGLSERVRFLEGSVPAGQTFDLTIANLPYVAFGEWQGLQPEVAKWEPREALLAGRDGLDEIRRLVPEVTHGTLALEVGRDQAGTVAELLREEGFGDVGSRRDLAGIERIVWGSR